VLLIFNKTKNAETFFHCQQCWQMMFSIYNP